MNTATILIEGLSGERVRWTDQLATFKSETERLIGNVLVLSAFLTYCGPFNQEFRLLLQKRWFDFIEGRRIPFSGAINIVAMLSDVATVCSRMFHQFAVKFFLTFILLPSIISGERMELARVAQ